MSFTAADGRRVTAETTRRGMTAHLPFQAPDRVTENSLMVVHAVHAPARARTPDQELRKNTQMG